MIYHHVTLWSKSRPVCHVMSARIASRVGLVSCSHVSEMATACKRKRSSYDAAFQLHVIESTENLNNYANIPRYMVCCLCLEHSNVEKQNVQYYR